MAATDSILPPPSSPYPPWPPRPHVPYNEGISRGSQDALLAGFVVFLLSTLFFAVLASRLHAKHRILHFVTLAITGIATLSYYAMLTKSGISWLPTTFNHIYWARYVDWVLTTPLLVLDLTILAGLPWVDTISLIVVSEVMALTALFAGLRHDSRASTWGWGAIGAVCFIYIAFQLLWKGRQSAKHQHADVASLYNTLSLYTIVIWVVYAVIFALSQGNGVLYSKPENIAYTVLDIFGKAVFGIWLLAVHRHESEDAAVCLSESWTESRAARRGAIQLPGGEE